MAQLSPLVTLPCEIVEEILTYLIPPAIDLYVHGDGLKTSVVIHGRFTSFYAPPWPNLTSLSRVHPRLTAIWKKILYGNLNFMIMNSFETEPYINTLTSETCALIKRVELHINHDCDTTVPPAIKLCCKHFVNLQQMKFTIDYAGSKADLEDKKIWHPREWNRIETATKHPGPLYDGRVKMMGGSPIHDHAVSWTITPANRYFKLSGLKDWDTEMTAEMFQARVTETNQTQREKLKEYQNQLRVKQSNQYQAWYRSSHAHKLSVKAYHKSLHNHTHTMMSNDPSLHPTSKPTKTQRKRHNRKQREKQQPATDPIPIQIFDIRPQFQPPSQPQRQFLTEARFLRWQLRDLCRWWYACTERRWEERWIYAAFHDMRIGAEMPVRI